MSTITREFTKEQLIAKAREQIAFCRNTKITGEGRTHVNQCSALFEIALASLEAEGDSEPVAFINGAWTMVYYRPPKELGLKIGDKLYTAPPAPVSDEDLLHMAASAIDDLLSNKDRSGAGVWADIPAKLRRAAMLQGAENVESPATIQAAPELDSSPKNAESPTGINQGKSEPVSQAYKLPERVTNALTLSLQAMEFMGDTLNNLDAVCEEDVEFVAPAFEAVRAELAGNSPVIPDGWVMVPVEPTEDMIVNGFESEPDESFSDEKEWEAYDAMSGCQQAAHRAKLCYAAMIAAAPKP
ncbi:hypothetical protein UXP06_15115 [Enterobacter ludwigii]|uniref:hypothetical protein n=1 Tax=Enterobacter ludwigii TaxID=299767 RepID=UPI002FCF40B2